MQYDNFIFNIKTNKMLRNYKYNGISVPLLLLLLFVVIEKSAAFSVKDIFYKKYIDEKNHLIPYEDDDNLMDVLDTDLDGLSKSVNDIRYKIQRRRNEGQLSLNSFMENFLDSYLEIQKERMEQRLSKQNANILSNIKSTLKSALNSSPQIVRQTESQHFLDDYSALESMGLVEMKLPASCTEALTEANGYSENGIYLIEIPDSGLKPFHVYCLNDPDGGAPWTIIQRRQDGSTNFYRTWDEYKRGFGDLSHEFFLGLEHIHALTNAESHELWIELGDFDNETRSAYYADFRLGDEATDYTLENLGTYSGNAGDALRKHEGLKFSTKDRDNDIDDRNCAILYSGAWWYRNCHDCNLNGLYIHGENLTGGKGIDWYQWHGHYYSLKYAHMAIRPNGKMEYLFE